MPVPLKYGKLAAKYTDIFAVYGTCCCEWPGVVDVDRRLVVVEQVVQSSRSVEVVRSVTYVLVSSVVFVETRTFKIPRRTDGINAVKFEVKTLLFHD